MELRAKEPWGTSIIWGTTLSLVIQIAFAQLNRPFYLYAWLNIGFALLVVGAPLVGWRRLKIKTKEDWGLSLCWGVTPSLLAWASFGVIQGPHPVSGLLGLVLVLTLFSTPIVMWRRLPNAEVPWRTCVEWGLIFYAVAVLMLGLVGHARTLQMWQQCAVMAIPGGLIAIFMRRRAPLNRGLSFREGISILLGTPIRQPVAVAPDIDRNC